MIYPLTWEWHHPTPTLVPFSPTALAATRITKPPGPSKYTAINTGH